MRFCERGGKYKTRAFPPRAQPTAWKLNCATLYLPSVDPALAHTIMVSACTKKQMNGAWPEAKVHLARCTRINHGKNRSLARPQRHTLCCCFGREQISLRERDAPLWIYGPARSSQLSKTKTPAPLFKCVSRFRHHFYWPSAQMANQSHAIEQHKTGAPSKNELAVQFFMLKNHLR